MANTTIDTSELEYLKSCRDKLRDITEIMKEEKGEEKEKEKDKDKDKETFTGEKLREILKIIKK